MARPKKAPEGAMTVLKADTIADGAGGFLKIGDTFTPVDDEARASHLAKGNAK